MKDFWKYLVKQRIWIFGAVLAIVAIFAVVWLFQSTPAGYDIKWAAIWFGGVGLLLVGGFYYTYRKNKKIGPKH